jgi:hypothetical protein
MEGVSFFEGDDGCTVAERGGEDAGGASTILLKN